MQNAVSRTLIVVFGLLLLVLTPRQGQANQASQLLVAQGRGQLFNSGEMTVSGILQSRDTFALAVLTDSGDQEARAFYGFTHALAFMFEDGTTGEIDNLQELFAAFGVSRTANDGIDMELFSDLPLHDDEYDPPAVLPGGEAVRAFVQGPLLDRIGEVLGVLNGVQSGFTTSVSSVETGDEPLAIDYADVQVFRSYAYAARTFALIISAYDLSCDLNDIVQLLNIDMLQFQRDLLDRYPTFLRLRPAGAGAANLLSAGQAFRSAVNEYHAAHDFIVDRIENDADWRDDHLFYFDSLAEANASGFYVTQLEEIQTSLDADRAANLTSSEQAWTLTDGATGNRIHVEFEKDVDDNLAHGGWHGLDGCNFVSCSGLVQDLDIEGSALTIVLSASDNYGGGEAVFTGTLSGGAISGGTYTGIGWSGPISGTFTGARQYEESLTEVVNANQVFGTGSTPAPLDIRLVLPDFNAYNQPLIGTFPGTPILNGILPSEPQFYDNDDATRQFELMPTGQFDIPTATIAIDGSFTDWPAAARVFDDISQDDPERSLPFSGNEDLESFWMAQDQNYYYMRTVYHDGAAQAGTSPYITFGALEDSEREYWTGPAPYCWVYPYSDEGGTIYTTQYGFNTYTGADNVKAGGDGSVEWRIPRSDFGDLSGRFIDLNTGFYSDRNPTYVQFSGYTVSGSVAIDGYTNGRIFLLLYNGEDPDTSQLLAGTVIDGPGAFSIDGLANMDSTTCYLYALWDRDGNGIVSFDDMYAVTSFLINDDVALSGLTVDQTIDFTVAGTVLNTHQPDGSNATYLEVEVDNFYNGVFPDDIDGVVFEGPGGIIATLADPEVNFERYDSNSGYYWLTVPGQPEPGTYTFTVISGNAERVSTYEVVPRKAMPFIPLLLLDD